MTLLALLIVCGPGASTPAQAGKKRRDASLETLRERNPAERWKLLQKMWRPLADDPPEPASTGVGTTPVSSAADLVPTGSNVSSPRQIPPPAQIVSPSQSITPASVGKQAQPVFVSPVPPAQEDLVASPGFPGTPVKASKAAPRRTEPVWLIDEAADPDPDEINRNTDHHPVAAPGPITDILPWRNYVPKGTPESATVICSEDSDETLCPKMDKFPVIGFEERQFADTTVNWQASNLFSNPLYFEDASLERYGHTHGDLIQPFFSVGKFSAQLVGLPYQMALHPVCERRYALGWYRPGECAPYKYYLPPWNTKAAISAGAVYTGLFYLIP